MSDIDHLLTELRRQYEERGTFDEPFMRDQSADLITVIVATTETTETPQTTSDTGQQP